MEGKRGTAATPAIIFVLALFFILFFVVLNRAEKAKELQEQNNGQENQVTTQRNIEDWIQEKVEG